MFINLARGVTLLVLLSAGLSRWFGDGALREAQADADRRGQPGASGWSSDAPLVIASLDGTEIDQLARSRRRFADYMDGMIVRLAKRQVRFAEATSALYYYCLAHYPVHLNHLQTMNAQADVKDNLARTLLWGLQEYQRAHGLAESAGLDAVEPVQELK